MSNEACAPTASYGILQQQQCNSALDYAVEQIQCLGYAILDSGYGAEQLNAISTEFNSTRNLYIEKYGSEYLHSINELNTVRAPLIYGGKVFLELAFNQQLLTLLRNLISGKFILNQQGCVINPPQQTYNQGAWHRDLPYQHFVSSKPLAVNALFCVDDFTLENGATFVLPASHKSESFPSARYIQHNAVQIEAKAGSYIVLDCMLFHSGGFNKTERERRAVNHVYTIPYFKQQIQFPGNMGDSRLTDEEKEILGFNYSEPLNISAYLATRKAGNY